MAEAFLEERRAGLVASPDVLDAWVTGRCFFASITRDQACCPVTHPLGEGMASPV